MTPEQLLYFYDHPQPWPHSPAPGTNVPLEAAYQLALQLRALRIQRGEVPCGFKVGFTNRAVWPRLQVDAPFWGSMFDTTVTFCEGSAEVSLHAAHLPRMEPECVFGMAATPPANPTLEQLCECIAWLAPGYEVVQSHQDWKLNAPDAVADGGLHAHLLVGKQVPLASLPQTKNLSQLLANARVTLSRDGQPVCNGQGGNVLDSPLLALQAFLHELRRCPNAPELQPGDVVTTGSWTDMQPVKSGETWTAEFVAPLSTLTVRFT